MRSSPTLLGIAIGLALAGSNLQAQSYNMTTIAGMADFNGNFGDGGQAVNAALTAPRDVAVDAGGNVYLAGHNIHRIRKVIASAG